MIDVPELVRNKAVALGATEWLDDLPDLVAELEREWSISVGTPYSDGTEAYVARASMADGTPAVLKLVLPGMGEAARREATVLRLAKGEGCPRLYREDVGRGALLIERLGPSLHALGLPLEQRLEILCAAAQKVWRAPRECELPSGADKGAWLVKFIERTWVDLGGPCSRRAVDYAIACARSRIAAHDEAKAVLVHGDVHEWNALRANDGFKLVDPDGLLAEPEYDLGVLMREDAVELLGGDPYDRARWLADRTGTDAEAIWEWGVVERVSTGLLCTKISLQPVGRQMLDAAEAVTP